MRKARDEDASFLWGWIFYLVDVATGERLLEAISPLENGGNIIFLRAIWITLEVFLLLQLCHIAGIWLTGPLPPFGWTKVPGWLANRLESEKLILFGCFAGSYTALYARFAAQWEYLASLYNQIKGAEIDLALTDRASLQMAHSGGRSREGSEIDLSTVYEAEYRIAELKNAFNVDAAFLHLANKNPFRHSCERWSNEPLVQLAAANLEREPH